jgi:hypothetical protein
MEVEVEVRVGWMGSAQPRSEARRRAAAAD